MFRATFHSVRCAVAPRLFLVPSLRKEFPSLSRAGIQYSRFPSSAKPRANTGDSSAVKPPGLNPATNVPAVGLHAAETSLAPLATSHASPQIESASSAVASIAASTGQNTAARARCSHGIIRHKLWHSMDSETRYHWRCLGWGPESWANGPNPPSDSKSWWQLNAVERMSAEWLGYNEKRWEGDSGNPFQDGAGGQHALFFTVVAGAVCFLIYSMIHVALRSGGRENAIAMSRSQRQLLKDFIMRKEAEVLDPGIEQRETSHEILETGAADCLYGLHTLFEKLLSSERESKSNWAVSTVSAAGWLHAIQSKHKQTLDPEEANIAQMLFDAADLDGSHTITFTEFAMLAVLLSATDAHDADAQVELLCNMVVSDEKQDRVDKDSARSFVLTCLRSGVRLDLKPKKSADGLVAHGMLDGLPVELKESGLAEQAGMIVLRERHKGVAWKAADAIIEPLFKLLDPQAHGHIPVLKFKQYFLHRLHPELERHLSSPVAHRGTSGGGGVRISSGHRTKGRAIDFNRVLQAARLKHQQRQASSRGFSGRSSGGGSRGGGGGGGGGCFTSGTGVLTPSGSQVCIDHLQLGDAVMAFDSEGLLQPATVRGCMRFLSDKHYVITLSSGSVIRVTGQHPVCVAPNAFCRADTLSVGDRVMLAAADCDSLVAAAVTQVEAVSGSTVVYNLSTTPHHTFFAADVAVHNKGGGGGGCFSGDAVVTLLSSDGGQKRVGMRMLKPGDVIQGAYTTQGDFSAIKSATGGGRILAVMSFLRSNAAPLYRYQGTIVTADHAVKTRDGWKRVRDTEDASTLSEEEAAAEGDVLFDILTESHQFSTSDGVIFADYEEVDDVTPENYARLIRELNLRDFGRASP